MNWYLLSLRVRNISGAPSSSFQRCHYLIEATDHETAYRRSLELNQRRIAQYAPEGIEDLLFISDVPKDGSELSWSEAELSAQELQDEIQPKERMHAFVSNQPKHSGWYVGRILLCEVHDEGSHGERLLVWIDSHLVAAANADEAYAKLTQIGRAQQDEAGSHKCDGEKAHWEFRGIVNLISLMEPPVDGARLWCDEVKETSKGLINALPEKHDLSVFRWAAEQERRGQVEQT